MLLIVKLGRRVIPSMRLGCVSAVGAHHAMHPIFVVKILHIGMPDIGEVIMNKASSLVVVSAPSGCGKDTIIEKVCQRLEGIGVSISCNVQGLIICVLHPHQEVQDHMQHQSMYHFLGAGHRDQFCHLLYPCRLYPYEGLYKLLSHNLFLLARFILL